jgi:hypothetical protein
MPWWQKASYENKISHRWRVRAWNSLLFGKFSISDSEGSVKGVSHDILGLFT